MLKEKLQELLEIRNMRPSELAKAAKIPPSLISEILNGRRQNLSLDTLKKISNAVGINILYFIEDDTIGPKVILSHLGDAEKAFVLDEHNAPFIKLTAQAVKKGLSPEQLGYLIRAVVDFSK